MKKKQKITNQNNANFKIAFVGNPNVGKSSLINRYSKKNKLSVGNWHGVTVEKQELLVNHKNKKYLFVDLPGIYDLNSKSIDEKITVSNILTCEFDLYILVIDITKLEEGLYLLQQLKEIGLPLLVIINFIDLYPDNASRVSFKKLEAIFKIPFIKLSSKKNINIKDSLDEIIKYVEKDKPQKNDFFLYDEDLNDLKDNIYNNLKSQGFEYAMGFSNIKDNKLTEFTSIKILEKSSHFSSHIRMENLDIKPINKLITEFEGKKARNLKDYITYKRKKFNENLMTTIGNNFRDFKHMKKTIFIDKFLLNKWMSLIFLFAIFLVSFVFIFNFSLPFKNWIDEFINSFVAGGISKIPMPYWLNSLIINGILNGVGTIITFTPIIFLLFIWINILRESGYMSRISFILTRAFNAIGLSGKSIVPLVLGFGCNVTSIYATRTIKSPIRRYSTALISPYMMCSARLPIVSLIIVSFFSQYASLILIAAYILGIFVAIVLGYLLKIKYSNKYDELNIDELPLYNWPNFKVVLHSSFINILGFLKKASTIILLFTIFIWLITYFPYGNQTEYAIEHSILATFSKYFAYIFYPLGFGHIWQLVASIIPAITAKEVVVAVLGILTNNGTTDSYINFSTCIEHLGLSVILALKSLIPIYWFSSFQQAGDMSNIASWLQNVHVPPGINASLCGLSFMIFILLTIPCVTTLAVMKKEFGAKFMWISVALGILVPYIVCLIFYWIGYLILLI